jgi:hypothetical protein
MGTFPIKQCFINRPFVDKNGLSNGYTCKKIVDVYFHTWRHCEDSPKTKIFKKWIFADCVESFLKDPTKSANIYL